MTEQATKSPTPTTTAAPTGQDLATALEGPDTIRENEPVEEIIRKFNNFHGFVIVGNKHRVIYPMYDPGIEGVKPRFMHSDDFRKAHYRLPKTNIAPPDQEPKWKRPVDIWMASESAQEYEGVVFAPGTEVPGCYNLWRGFAVEPNPSASCARFLRHIHEVIADGDDYAYHYVLSWLARIVQDPQNGPGTALTLRGNQGVGKGTFVDYVGRLFGQHYKHVTNPQHITGKFNQHLADALVVFADEAFFAGDKTAVGRLKSLITDRMIMIEQKGLDAIHMRNHVNLLISSNEDWVVPTEVSDRRFCVLDIPDTYKKDTAYFASIHEEMENGGLEAFLYFLLEYDLSEWAIDFEQFPETQARIDQKLHSLTPSLKWLHYLADYHDLAHLIRPGADAAVMSAAQDWANQSVTIASEDLWTNLGTYLRSLGVRNVPASKEMKKVIDQAVPSAVFGKARSLGGNSPIAYVQLPPRGQFRAELADYIGIPESAL